MEIQITPAVANAVCNSLRASKQSLRLQLREAQSHQDGRKAEIIRHQLNEVEEALAVFQELEI
jgi:hypothetical protein